MLQVITGFNVPALYMVWSCETMAIMVVQAFTTGAYYYLLINNCLMIAYVKMLD